jgi:hypothetical protein
LQSGWCESDVPVLRFTVVAPQTEAFHQRNVKKSYRTSNRQVLAGVSFPDRLWRHPMRAVSYMIALALVLTAPSLADTADGGLPGIGTFSYCGTPILASTPEVVAALGH